jgi:hypothetical protein
LRNCAIMAHMTTRSKPMALCLERLAGADEDRYVRCTAQVGRELGLALGTGGRILWCEQGGAACEIWVSADQRLMAYCPADTPPTTLHRAGRILELPKNKPVVLRHEDELHLDGARFRVHVHGIVDAVRAPTVVRTVARAAAAVALAVTVGASGCDSAESNSGHRDAGRDSAESNSGHRDAGRDSAESNSGHRDAGRDAPIELLKPLPATEDARSVPDAAPSSSDAGASDAIEVLETPPLVY